MRVAISGAAGRMGRIMIDAVDGAPDLDLVGLYAPGHGGQEVAGHALSEDPASLKGAEVIVESTRPDVVVSNLRRWADTDAHVVIGTSGVEEGQISEFWPSARGCLIVPNFSVGAVLMMRFAELAAPHFSAAEVVEMHHDEKVDAPSATATNTARRIAAAKPDQQRRRESSESVSGVRGGRVEDVPVHSIRLPGLVAHQEVLFGGDGEILTLRHDSTSRSSFAAGVLAAIRHVPSIRGVHTGLDAALGL